MYFIFLASHSPRRRDILRRMGLEFEVVSGSTDEDLDIDEPRRLVRELALEKARAAVPNLRERDGVPLVVAGDTVVHVGGEILGKPPDRGTAVRMLRELSGESHEVVTGVAVLNPESGEEFAGFEVTEVEFRVLSSEEIEAYVSTGEADDKAGSYGIQGRGSVLVRRIKGSYDNVVGLPSALLLDLLRRAGMPVERLLFRS